MAAIKPKGNKVTGTKKKDKITWTNSSAWKKALNVYANAGNDIINFKKSKYKNKLYGQTGNDTVYGGIKNDTIHGNAGADKLYGYNGADKIYGDDGSDKIYGGNGNDTLYAGKGNDYIDGGNNNDKIYGNYGTNTLKGSAGNDSIYGGTGTDKIYGGSGNDYINAGKGTNYIYLNKKEGTDTIVKGGGSDTVVFSQEKNFNNFTFYYNGNNLIFNANGSSAVLKDFLLGGHSAKYIQAGSIKYKLTNKTAGTDALGTSGNDFIISQIGDDTINAAAGDNTIMLMNGNKTVQNGGGTDTLLFANENSFGNLTSSILNEDVVITTSDGSEITLPDFQTGNSSVKYVQIGKEKKNLIVGEIGTPYYQEDIYNIENIADSVRGTNNADFIDVKLKENRIGSIYAGAGNDYIAVRGCTGEDLFNGDLKSSSLGIISAGAGDDIIDIYGGLYEGIDLTEGNNILNLKGQGIYIVDLLNTNGNNIINGFENQNRTFPSIFLVSRDILRGNNQIKYISSEQSANDLIINLTNGKTLTISNYYSIEDASVRANMLKFHGITSGLGSVESYLRNNDEYMDIPTGSNTFTNLQNKILVSNDNSADYSLTLSGAETFKNQIFLESDGEKYINITSKMNYVQLDDTHNNGTKGTTFDVSGSNNTIEATDSKSVIAHIAGTNNTVNIYSPDMTVSTSYGRNDVWLSYYWDTPSSAVVTSYGNDKIHIEDITAVIDYDKDDTKNKSIYSDYVKNNIDIKNAADVKGTILYLGEEYNNYKLFITHTPFEGSNGEDYISLKCIDKNTGEPAENTGYVNIYGNWEDGYFNLNDKAFADKFTVCDYNYNYKNLNQLTQYIDYNNADERIDGSWGFVFGSCGELRFTNWEDGADYGKDYGRDYFIQGTVNQDHYEDYDFNGRYTIADLGSLSNKGDTFNIEDDIMYIQDVRPFFDIYYDENGVSFGSDLYLFSAEAREGTVTDYSKFITNRNADVNYVCIKDAFTGGSEGGKIEHIQVTDGGLTYELNYDVLLDFSAKYDLDDNYITTLSYDVADWLCDNGFTSTMDAYENGTASQLDALAVIYNNHTMYGGDKYDGFWQAV